MVLGTSTAAPSVSRFLPSVQVSCRQLIRLARSSTRRRQSLIRCLSLSKLLLLHAMVSTPFPLDLSLQQLHAGDPLSELDPLDILELELLLLGLRQRFAGQRVERSSGAADAVLASISCTSVKSQPR